MSIIGTIAVNLVAKTGDFVSGVAKARKSLNEFASSSDKASKAWSGASKLIGAGLAAVSAGAVVSSLKATASELDNLAKTADKLGVSTEALSSLRFGAGLSGVETSALDTALQKLSQRVSEAAQGTGEAKAALAELGIAADQLAGKTPDVMLARVADAMTKVEKQSDKVRIATKLFEEGGVSMLNMLKDGSAGLSAFRREAEALGITLDRDSLAKVEAFNDAMAKLQSAMGAFKNALVIDIAPAATEAIGALTEAIKGIRLLQQNAKSRGGGAGLTSRLFTGQTGWQKAMENYFINRGIRNGVAMGAEAPSMAQMFGPSGVVLDRAKSPFMRQGPIAEALGKRADAAAAAEAEKRRAESARAQSVKKLRSGLTGSIAGAITSATDGGMGALRFLAEKRAQAEVAANKWTMEQAFRPRTGPTPEFIERMNAIKSKWAMQGQEAATPLSGNEALRKGSAAAFAAEKSSGRINAMMREQIAIAKAQKEALDTIAANTKQKELDDLWRMAG